MSERADHLHYLYGQLEEQKNLIEQWQAELDDITSNFDDVNEKYEGSNSVDYPDRYYDLTSNINNAHNEIESIEDEILMTESMDDQDYEDADY